MSQETSGTNERDIRVFANCVHLPGNPQRFRLCTGCILALVTVDPLVMAAKARSRWDFVEWHFLHAN